MSAYVYEDEFVKASKTVENRLEELLRSILGVSSVGATTNFFDLGLTSTGVVKLFTVLHREFGGSLSLTDLIEEPIIERLAAVLRERG